VDVFVATIARCSYEPTKSIAERLSELVQMTRACKKAATRSAELGRA